MNPSLNHIPLSLSRHYRVWTSLHLPSREYYHLRLDYIITITQNFLLSPHSSTAYYLRVDGSSVFLSWKDYCKNKAPLLIWYSSVLVKLSCQKNWISMKLSPKLSSSLRMKYYLKIHQFYLGFQFIFTVCTHFAFEVPVEHYQSTIPQEKWRQIIWWAKCAYQNCLYA